MLDLAGDLACSFPSNYSEIPNSCLFVQLPLAVDVSDVLVDHCHRNLKELRDQRLTQPQRLIRETAFDPRPTILGLVKDDLSGWR